jgi:hypothetical protein
MGGQQAHVILRFRSGQTERAALGSIDSDRQIVEITREDGAQAEVSFSVLKAVFFPRAEAAADEAIAASSTVAVEFSDGEFIRGIADYNPEKNGFFLYPHDRSKNDRIFVVNSAITSIEVERL